MSISINPSLTVAPPSSFLSSTQGYTQGIALADPSARQWLLSAAINSTVTQPLWGGMALTELVATAGADGAGNSVELASTQANVTGFSVFNRGYNMINTPGNNVQTASAGMSLPYYRLGSNIRIPVLATAALLTAVEGNGINTQVQWDFTNQQLIPYASGTALNVKVVGVSTNAKIVNYNSGTGAVTWSTGDVAIIQL